MADPEGFEVTIPSDTAEGRKVQDRIVSLLEQNAFSMRDVFAVRLALEEALVNAIKHGNRMDPDKVVKVECWMLGEKVRIEIEDQGAGFDVNNVPDPTAEENLDKPGGRGIMLMKSFMSCVEYNNTGNRVVLEKERNHSEDEPSDD